MLKEIIRASSMKKTWRRRTAPSPSTAPHRPISPPREWNGASVSPCASAMKCAACARIWNAGSDRSSDLKKDRGFFRSVRHSPRRAGAWI